MMKNYYSTLPNNDKVIPEILYLNADTDRNKIIADNRGKSGVYRWVNK